ncbi:MAG: DUF4258 domain-containing protein [Chloroflexi bacterium]|nr:DUF4258 domain-containing protein [Chloroflexota bacterium]
MEIRLTGHADSRMNDAGLTREDVVFIIESGSVVEQGVTASLHEATVRGIPFRVVVKRDSDPPLVITVFEVYRLRETTMRIEYDGEADVLLVHLAENPGHTRGKQIDERRIVHYDDSDRPVEIELLFASQGVDVSGLPESEALADLLRSFPRLVA